MNTNHDALREAAQELIDRWETPLWKDAPATAVYIAKLRSALSQPMPEAAAQCWCETCRPITLNDMRMVLCPDCGNKRCPKAKFHGNACTNSNEVGQPGSSWEHVKPLSAPPAAPEVEKPCSYPVCGCQKVDPRTLKGCAAQPPHPQPQAQGEPEIIGYVDQFGNFEFTLQQWMKDEPGTDWQPVISLQSHREAIAKRDAALVACVEAMKTYDMLDAEAKDAITKANEAVGRKEGGV